MIDLARASGAAERAAYAAGTHLLASRSRLAEVMITRQEPEAVVAAIEKEVVALIREVLLGVFPQHGLIANRRRPDPNGLRDATRPQWIVDPLDGRSNYLRGYPQYAVSIALVDNGEPVLGVVYDPVRNEFFGAIHGLGAVLNGQPVHSAPPRAPAAALAGTVFPAPTSAHMQRYLAEFGRVVAAFSNVRRSGSLALELAYLAAGRIDAFWAHDLGALDAAAAVVLLREGGALVQARDGRPLLGSASLLACTATMYEPFLSLLVES